MPDKPLNRAEQGVLQVLTQHHAKHGPVERTVLSVEVRGRGLEFGRALGRLMSLGLAEEITRKPFVLWRLFGARVLVLLQPTAAGLAAVQAPLPEPAAPLDEATAAEPAPTSEPATDWQPTPVTITPPKQAVPPKPAAKAKPAKAKPRPKPVTAFTEDLGGTPLPLAAPSLPTTVDPATLEGLRETLSVMGLDLTPAGEALAAHRIANGASPAEALSQVVLFAFAHAVSQDLYNGGPVAELGLRHYATEVLREVEKLRSAGELAGGPFAHDKRQLLALLEESPDRAAFVRDLLADPMGGAAPPAVLPEELRRSDDE